MKRLLGRHSRSQAPSKRTVGLILHDNTLGRRCYQVEDSSLIQVEQISAQTDWIISFEPADQRYPARSRLNNKDALELVLSQPNADEHARLLNLSGGPHRVIYSRNVDSILDEAAPITPGVLLLDLLLEQGVPADGLLTGFVFGSFGDGCVGMLVGYLADGQVLTQVVPQADEAKIKQYLKPFADKCKLILPVGDVPLFTLGQIDALFTRAPRYDRETRLLGVPRSLVLQLAVGLLGLMTLITGAGALWQGGRLWQTERQIVGAQAESQAFRLRNTRFVQQNPLVTCQAMSLPVPALFSHAKSLWQLGTRVRFKAQATNVLYTVSIPTKTTIGQHSTMLYLSRANALDAVETALLAPTPAGLNRGEIRVTGDLNVIEIDYSQALPAGLAGLVAR